MDELLGTRARPERWSRSGALCAERGQHVPFFPHALFHAPVLFLRCASDSFSVDEAEHLLQNRMASVAKLRGCSGSSRNAVRIPFGAGVRLRRNSQTAIERVAGTGIQAGSAFSGSNLPEDDIRPHRFQTRTSRRNEALRLHSSRGIRCTIKIGLQYELSRPSTPEATPERSVAGTDVASGSNGGLGV
jgi:hypothetical protein